MALGGQHLDLIDPRRAAPSPQFGLEHPPVIGRPAAPQNVRQADHLAGLQRPQRAVVFIAAPWRGLGDQTESGQRHEEYLSLHGRTVSAAK